MKSHFILDVADQARSAAFYTAAPRAWGHHASSCLEPDGLVLAFARTSTADIA